MNKKKDFKDLSFSEKIALEIYLTNRLTKIKKTETNNPFKNFILAVKQGINEGLIRELDSEILEEFKKNDEYKAKV